MYLHLYGYGYGLGLLCLLLLAVIYIDISLLGWEIVFEGYISMEEMPSKSPHAHWHLVGACDINNCKKGQNNTLIGDKPFLVPDFW